MGTEYVAKAAILADLWMYYRSDEDFQDFVEYNDLGLPLAYAVASDIIASNEKVQKFIEESFDLLLAGLEVEDTGFEDLDELLALDESEDD